MGKKIKAGGRDVDVLIVAQPNRYRDGLRAVVQALDWVKSVGTVPQLMSITDYIQHYCPVLVIFDAHDLESITWEEAEILRRSCQNTKSIAIIDRALQRDRVQALGVSAILLRGFSTELLYSTMRTLVVAHDPKVPVTGPLGHLRL